jgi:hypothetical protein
MWERFPRESRWRVAESKYANAQWFQILDDKAKSFAELYRAFDEKMQRLDKKRDFDSPGQ